MKRLLILLIGIIFISACIGNETREDAISLCVQECQSRSPASLMRGPCLLDPIPEYPDWVCDVAHSPRITTDNFPENQCSKFIEGTSHHFVEVSPECTLIQAS
ncbi:MAG: hypothetical protein ACE5J3_12700 [Methanosarcinales archaeon]